MKNLSKRIATIAATLALVVVLGVSLAACGSKSYKELTLDEYKANLEAAKYSVGVAPKDQYANYATRFNIPEEMVADIDWMFMANAIQEDDEDEDEEYFDGMPDIAMVRFNDVKNTKAFIDSYKELLSETKKEMKASFNEMVKDLDKKSDAYKTLKAQYDETMAMFDSFKIVRAGNVAINAFNGAALDAAYTTAPATAA